MRRRLPGRITVLLGAEALKRVRAHAKARKVSASCAVREIVETALNLPRREVSAFDLSRAWVGAINDAGITPGAKIREALADGPPERR